MMKRVMFRFIRENMAWMDFSYQHLEENNRMIDMTKEGY